MRYNIQRYKKSLTIADGQTAISSTAEELNGLLRGILCKVPQLDGTTTITVAVIAVDGSDEYTLFSKASIAENANTPVLVDANNEYIAIPLSGNIKITVTASGAQSGGNDTVGITLLIDRGN